jgi:hypothetical protein
MRRPKRKESLLKGTLQAPDHFLIARQQGATMNNIIYLVGLVVVVGAILSFVFH